MSHLPHYTTQIVPAPPGWRACGSPDPGEEFWYESTDGIGQVFPHEDGGWVRQEGAIELLYDNPQAAFRGDL